MGCTCRPGVERDNCPKCEGTGTAIDFSQFHRCPKCGKRGDGITYKHKKYGCDDNYIDTDRNLMMHPNQLKNWQQKNASEKMFIFDRAWGLVKEDYSFEQCDSCGDTARVAELRLSEPGDYGESGGYSAINLCRDCWANEMEWRQAKNEEFEYQMQDDVKPDIPDDLNDHGAVADFIEHLSPFFKPTEESMFPILPFPFTESYE